MANEIKIKLTIDGKEATATLDLTDARIQRLIGNTKTSFQNVSSILKNIAGTLGLAFGVNELLSFSRDALKLSLDLENLRSNFRGSAADIELFRKATAETVSEANLIKLSNQATDLGLSLEEQAQLFYLAEKAADKYGGSLEENFQKVVIATEGNTRGLKLLGIQKAVYENEVRRLAAAHGEEINKLDAETQKQIRVQAVLRATGVTMNDVNNQVADAKDRWEQMNVALEESKTNFGDFVRTAGAGWMDFIRALAQGGTVGVGAFIQMNTQLDIMLNNMRSIRQMYADAIVAAGTGAESDVRNKSAPEIQKMINDTSVKIKALQNLGKKQGFDADTKNDLQQLQAKLRVYQATLDLMNFMNKDKDKDKLIRYDKEIQKEIALTEAKLKGNLSERERVLLKEKLKSLQDELIRKEQKSIANDELAKGSAEIFARDRKQRIDDYEKELQLKREEADLQSKISELQQGDPWGDYLRNIDRQADNWDVLKNSAQDTMRTITMGFLRAKMYGEDFNQTLKNIVNQFLDMGIMAVFSGLFSVIGGGTFGAGFLASLGINSNYAGGIINEPIYGIGMKSGQSYSFGEKGYEMVRPLHTVSTVGSGGRSESLNLDLTIRGEFAQKGKDLHAVVKAAEKIIKRYK